MRYGISQQKETPSLGEEVEEAEATSTRVFYSSVSRDGVEYKVGDCCYIDPEAFDFNVQQVQAKKAKQEKKEV